MLNVFAADYSRAYSAYEITLYHSRLVEDLPIIACSVQDLCESNNKDDADSSSQSDAR
jgi:hypothetical protein